VLDQYVQQWSAIQTARAADLSATDVFMAYFALTGDADEFDVEGYLSGLLMLVAADRDLIAHAINELLDGTGSMVDGAHYSGEDAAGTSGYEEYLRALNLTPEGYDFTAAPAGDCTTSTAVASGHSALSNQSLEGNDNEDAGQGVEDEVEFRRLHALYESRLLESGAEERFDRFTRQARDHFGVSSSSIALITEDAQVIKSVIGPLGQDLPRDLSLCAVTIQQDRTLVIADASLDPHWRNHPLVAGGPKVRFYAGHPVCTADGWRIGTLCLMDDQPRTFTDEDIQVLQRLALQVQLEIWV
jgi:GAF domain-containing protein